MNEKECITYPINLPLESLLSKVFPMLIPGKNIPGLKKQGIVYKQVLDMAVIFYIPRGGRGIVITKEIMEQLGFPDDVYHIAVKNMETEYTIDSLESIIIQLTGSSDLLADVDYHTPAWIVSNREKMIGASAILSECVLQELGKIIGSKFVILPSSVHEVIALPYEDESDLYKYLLMVTEINASTVGPEDYLADNVYTWSQGHGLEALVI